jgi:hypothetical protein
MIPSCDLSGAARLHTAFALVKLGRTEVQFLNGDDQALSLASVRCLGPHAKLVCITHLALLGAL